jgi:CubicO group peptidase (beta-lactamase class C family)
MKLGTMTGACIALLFGMAVQAQPTVPPVKQAVAAAPVTAAPAATPALTQADVDAWLDGVVPYALDTAGIPGAVVVVVKDGQIISKRGFGYADVVTRKPVDPDLTLFRPGSVSKLITWTAVMQLVEAHKIDLDADINTYLDFKIPPREGKPITMRQLMTHTGGFEDHAKNLLTTDPKSFLPLGTYIKAWVPNRIFAPGETPSYSNYGTALAGYIVERVSGMSFDDYVEHNIFAPLGMAHSSFRQPLPASLAPFMSGGYKTANGPAEKFEMIMPAPAGSMSSSGTDMARFMIAHLQGGELDGKRILSAETAAMMHNSPLDRVNPRSLIPPLNRMELGFFETNINGHEVVGHLGDSQFFHTSLHLFINDGVGLYLSLNSAGKEGAAQNVRSMIFTGFGDRYFLGTVKDGTVDAKVAAEHAKLMAGVWQGSRRDETGFFRVVSVISQTKVGLDSKGGLLVADLRTPAGAPMQWTEIAPFVWRETGGHVRLAAQVVDGKPVRWSMDSESPFVMFDRVPASKSAAWLMPALYTSLGVLALTFLFWPAAAIVRRRYKTPLAGSGVSRRVYRGLRLGAGVSLLVLGGWIAFVTSALGELGTLGSASDWKLWVLQIVGFIAFAGTALLAAWNLLLAQRERRHWTAKLWALLMLLAALVVLYFAALGGLIDMTVNY